MTETLGQRLKARRLELGLTLQEVGNKMRCSKQFISQIEHEKRDIPTNNLEWKYLLDEWGVEV